MTNPDKLPVRPRWLATILEAALNLRPLGSLYDARPTRALHVTHAPHATQATQATSPEFLQYALDALGIDVHINSEENLTEIPATGPLLIVANHPLGGLESLVIARLIGQLRPDIKVLGNQWPQPIPELADMFITLGDTATDNMNGIRQLHRHLRNGGAALVFPAGAASVFDLKQRRIQDAPWNRLVGGLVRRYGCTTLPMYVSGRNSVGFYVAGLLHPRLRTLLLLRQLARQWVKQQSFKLSLTIGRPVPATELRLFSSAQAVTEYLRVSTDALRPQTASTSSVRKQVEQLLQVRPRAQAARAIADLQDCLLIEHEELDVYCTPYERLGPVMDEIAIAREVSFRAVGEGTGRGKDSDQFDPHYLHLFLWDKHQQRIAGAYRVGLVDEIVAEHGVKGLYSRSLYKYDKAFIRQLGSAIEMGRSFIHPDYQRKPTSLNLLWRGVGKILVQTPHYHTLFGSVSISRDYSDLARALIADTMLTNYRADNFDALVKPITPHKVANRVWSHDILTELANIKMLGKLVGRCDPGKAVPVLLRHYLSLNGRLVCFNIHPDFNDSLEGLIIVDVRKTDPKTLNRFMGEDGARHFLTSQVRRSA
ncbi:MAG: lysophospholipid acyltransferase family protein [Pseudohongiellaceae bacterium]